MKSTAVILGSINFDIVAKAERLPAKGETVGGESIDMFVGGKGSNQTAQMSLLGLETHFVGQIGKDDAGKSVYKALQDKGVNIRYLEISDEFRTGCCSIVVDTNGDNTLVYAPGANHNIPIGLVENARTQIENADIFVTQNEINPAAMAHGLSIAKTAGVITVLNPAPAIPLDDELYSLIDYIVPNESECAVYTGIDQCGVAQNDWTRKSAKWFLDKGVKNVCITLGEKGVYFCNDSEEHYLPAIPVKAVDTTAAGDAFIGGFSYGLANKKPLLECMQIGNACGALAATVLGAQNSLQGMDSVRKILKL